MAKGKKLDVKTGDVYGRLTIIKELEAVVYPCGSKSRMMLCSCSCDGKEVKVRLDSLRSGKTTSCGCIQKERQKEAVKKYNKYDLSMGYGVGYTKNGDKFIFDLEDYGLIKDYFWNINNMGYVYCLVWKGNKCKNLFLHKLVMNCPNNKQVDHINRDKLNNRKSNLRICMAKENYRNRGANSRNTSGVIGVCFDKKSNKWKSQIWVDGKSIYLGTYEDKNEAIKVRLAAEKKYFGEFAPQDENVLDQSK